MEVITGLSIPTNGFMSLEVDSDKACYIVGPDGSVITSTLGAINQFWEGIPGAVQLIIPINTHGITSNNSGFYGEMTVKHSFPDLNFNDVVPFISTDGITTIIADKVDNVLAINRGVIYLSAKTADKIDAGECPLTSFDAPMAKTVLLSRCDLTAKSIGDFLFSAKANNPTTVGATADFSGGTNALKSAVATYMGLASEAALTTWVTTNLPSWGVTFRLS